MMGFRKTRMMTDEEVQANLALKTKKTEDPLKDSYESLKKTTIADMDTELEKAKKNTKETLRETLASRGIIGSPLAAELENRVLSDMEKETAVKKAVIIAQMDNDYQRNIESLKVQWAQLSQPYGLKGMDIQERKRREKEIQQQAEAAGDMNQDATNMFSKVDEQNNKKVVLDPKLAKELQDKAIGKAFGNAMDAQKQKNEATPEALAKSVSELDDLGGSLAKLTPETSPPIDPTIGKAREPGVALTPDEKGATLATDAQGKPTYEPPNTTAGNVTPTIPQGGGSSGGGGSGNGEPDKGPGIFIGAGYDGGSGAPPSGASTAAGPESSTTQVLKQALNGPPKTYGPPAPGDTVSSSTLPPPSGNYRPQK